MDTNPKSFNEVEENESQFGRILKVNSHLVVAEQMKDAKIHDLVNIGQKNLLGEVIKLKGDSVFIQCYEDTSGLDVGDLIMNTKEPLQVELGPGILGQFFDSLQRPLEIIDKESHKMFIPQKTNLSPLNTSKEWSFVPNPNINIGSKLTGGDIYGYVNETNLFQKHNLMVPPNCKGQVSYIAIEGMYTIHEKILELEFDGKVTHYNMSHFWPVRQARPYQEKIQPNIPLLTGYRVFDTLFPTALGGTCALVGDYGKGAIYHMISKNSNSDVNVYAGCGEYGDKKTEMLIELSELNTLVNGRQEQIMQRTCIVANASNMPILAREVSILTGITIAEYFRDMGYNSLVMADSTSSWIEEKREISNLIQQMPGEQGNILNLAKEISQFYERAGLVKCYGSPNREGSVSIIGQMSPPEGNFNDLTVTSTLETAQVFWGLDKRLAKIKHFPAINWRVSYSNYHKNLYPYYDTLNLEFSHLHSTLKNILLEDTELLESDIERNQLRDQQQLTLEIANVFIEDYLFQNAYSPFDFMCPIQKSIGMMRAIVSYYEQSKNLISHSLTKRKMKWDDIKEQTSKLYQDLCDLKFSSPNQSKEDFSKLFDKFEADLHDTFKQLSEN